MFDIWQASFSEALHQIASSEPVPGGGAASAMSGLIGLSLVRMAINVTKGTADESVAKQLIKADSDLSRIGAELRNAANADMDAFSSYMAAIRMPKGTSDLDESRNKALEDAIHNSITIPFSAVEQILAALMIAKGVEPVIKDSIVSDLLSGNEIMKGAATSILFNIDANSKSKRLENKRNEIINRRIEVLDTLSFVCKSVDDAGKRRGFIIRT